MSMSANGGIRESASTVSDAIFLWKTHTGTAPSLITYTLHQDSLNSVDDPSICCQIEGCKVLEKNKR